MKKIISLLMAAVLAAAMFAGCSSSSSGTTGTTSGKDGKLNPALEGEFSMAGNNNNGLSFWGVVGAVLLALIIFSIDG